VCAQVTFETKQPLGVVLERSKEWAVVKLANPALSAVTVGSALAAVNGKSVVLKPYHTTIDLLTNWRPPLHLVFRRCVMVLLYELLHVMLYVHITVSTHAMNSAGHYLGCCNANDCL
jgi:hypothetical protein